MMNNKEQLVDYVNQGNQVKYVFFWGHQKPESGVTKTCFSQWYEAGFTVDGIHYPTAEHYMMTEKARLFGDDDAARQVLQANNPGAAKKVGRTVKNFDESLWLQHRFRIVVEANMAKFSQNSELQAFLLNTGDRVLVEASPVDKIWGIGLAADDPAAENPNLWKGLNLLGFALMTVRQRLNELMNTGV